MGSWVMTAMYMLLCLFAACPAQVYVASTLGVPMHKLVCKTKRIGGGFGGKETRRCGSTASGAVQPVLCTQTLRDTED